MMVGLCAMPAIVSPAHITAHMLVIKQAHHSVEAYSQRLIAHCAKLELASD